MDRNEAVREATASGTQTIAFIETPPAYTPIDAPTEEGYHWIKKPGCPFGVTQVVKVGSRWLFLSYAPRVKAEWADIDWIAREGGQLYGPRIPEPTP